MFDDQRWRDSYDRWKLASPDDDMPDEPCDICGSYGPDWCTGECRYGAPYRDLMSPIDLEDLYEMLPEAPAPMPFLEFP
jgi:hypothetical protein